MALIESPSNPNIRGTSSDLEQNSAVSADPAILITAALKFNNLTVDEGFGAFDQVDSLDYAIFF